MTSPLARSLSAALLVLLPLFPACKALDPKPDYKMARPHAAIVPNRFLHTENPELRAWLDQAIRVHVTEDGWRGELRARHLHRRSTVPTLHWS